MSKFPVEAWYFESSSSTATYETVRWSDDSLSCNCHGWTRRVTNNGRSCKHTREVIAFEGAAPSAIKKVSYVKSVAAGTVKFNQSPASEPVTSSDPFARKFNL